MALCLIEIVVYFTHGLQLEYFSGVFTASHQALEFNYNLSIEIIEQQEGKCSIEPADIISGTTAKTPYLQSFCSFFNFFILFEPIPRLLFEEWTNFLPLQEQRQKLGWVIESSGKLNQLDYSRSFYNLSTNEGKSWFYLWITFLSYFFCLELSTVYLQCLLVYSKTIYIGLFIAMQVYSLLSPATLKQERRGFWLLASLLSLVYIAFNQHGILLLAGTLEEYRLEQLDSQIVV
jgi:hypothetical protein